MQKDKLLHFIGGAAIAVLFSFKINYGGAIAVAATIGALKEFRDWRAYGKADSLDVLATVVGGIAGAAIQRIIF